jgi:hypothetical protein
MAIYGPFALKIAETNLTIAFFGPLYGVKKRRKASKSVKKALL